MKQDSIQQLLAKRQAGTISDEELETLNRLTRRDEVFAAADRQAKGIVRRRRIGLSALALTIVAAGGAGLLFLQPSGETPTVAKQEPAAPTVVETITVEEIATPATPATVIEDVAATHPRTAEPQPKKPAAASTRATTNPVVVCNNQCEADSVISDIWKFLTA
jgi:hypothetical protein